MAALIKPPNGDLEKGLSSLEPGEEWVLKPEMVDNNPHIWSPGIKYGVRSGSYTHLTEFFGPLLGVMRAENLDQAISLVNQTGYGLTSGLESLDKREQLRWKEKIFAGNLYINRGTTGAIVLRQPFGGMGKSALGPGLKAGSPDYVTQFMNWSETGFPQTGVVRGDHVLLRRTAEWRLLIEWNKLQPLKKEIYRTIRAIESYLYAMQEKFSLEEDYFHLRGQDNILRYLPIKRMMIRLHPDDSLFETLARIGAAKVAGCSIRISKPEGMTNESTDFLAGRYGREFLDGIAIDDMSDDELADQMGDLDRIRYSAAQRVPLEIFRAAAETGFYVSRTPVFMEGRLELLQYFQQQAICDSYHRYGNLGERALE